MKIANFPVYHIAVVSGSVPFPFRSNFDLTGFKKLLGRTTSSMGRSLLIVGFTSDVSAHGDCESKHNIL